MKINLKTHYLARVGTKKQIDEWKKWAKQSNKIMKGLKTVRKSGEYFVYSPYSNLD